MPICEKLISFVNFFLLSCWTLQLFARFSRCFCLRDVEGIETYILTQSQFKWFYYDYHVEVMWFLCSRSHAGVNECGFFLLLLFLLVWVLSRSKFYFFFVECVEKHKFFIFSSAHFCVSIYFNLWKFMQKKINFKIIFKKSTFKRMTLF